MSRVLWQISFMFTTTSSDMKMRSLGTQRLSLMKVSWELKIITCIQFLHYSIFKKTIAYPKVLAVYVLTLVFLPNSFWLSCSGSVTLGVIFSTFNLLGPQWFPIAATFIILAQFDSELYLHLVKIHLCAHKWSVVINILCSFEMDVICSCLATSN